MSNINITYVTPLTRVAQTRNENFRDRNPRQEERDEPPKEEETPDPTHRVDITV